MQREKFSPRISRGMLFPRSLILRCCSGMRASADGSSMTMSRGTCIARRRQISGPITTISAGRTRQMRRNSCTRHMDLDRGIILTMTRIGRVGGGIIIIIDGSALSIRRLVPAGMSRGLHHVQMVADQGMHRRGLHHRLHLQNVPVDRGGETARAGMGTHLLQTWTMHQMLRIYQIIHRGTRSTSANPNDDPTTTTSHHQHTPAPAVIHTTHTHENPRAIFPPHHRTPAKTTTTSVPQNPANPARSPGAATTAPAPAQQASNSAISSSTGQSRHPRQIQHHTSVRRRLRAGQTLVIGITSTQRIPDEVATAAVVQAVVGLAVVGAGLKDRARIAVRDFIHGRRGGRVLCGARLRSGIFLPAWRKMCPTSLRRRGGRRYTIDDYDRFLLGLRCLFLLVWRSPLCISPSISFVRLRGRRFMTYDTL